MLQVPGKCFISSQDQSPLLYYFISLYFYIWNSKHFLLVGGTFESKPGSKLPLKFKILGIYIGYCDKELIVIAENLNKEVSCIF